jgi:hypothetical protein
MQTPKPKQVSVLNVKGSLNNQYDIIVNTTTPIPKPINLLGHICPLYAIIIFFTDIINRYDIGTPTKAIIIG